MFSKLSPDMYLYIMNLSEWTYTCWKRRMLSSMLNCCQRLEKLTFPSMRSGFPRWTKVKSWRMRPLEEEGQVIESTRGPMCGFKHECNHWLTGTGYTEARLQPERLCMLWRRRSCQSTCNTPPIPKREEGVRGTWEKGHNDGDDAHQWEGGLDERMVCHLWGLLLPLQSPDGGRVQGRQYCQVRVEIVQLS